MVIVSFDDGDCFSTMMLDTFSRCFVSGIKKAVLCIVIT